MGTRIEKVKVHIREHKVEYACALTAIVVAGITVAIMKTNLSGKARIIEHTGSGKSRIIENTESVFVGGSNNIVNSIVSVVEREGRGHPGYMVRHIESGLVWMSQKAAADAFGYDYVSMSNHINGRTEHLFGDHFERIHMAA